MRPCAAVHPDPKATAAVCQFCRGDPAPSFIKLPPAPQSPPPKPIAEWSLTARLIAKLKVPTDAGLGDTIARHLDRFGGDAFKRLYKKITGSECGCANRQAALNALYPYQE